MPPSVPADLSHRAIEELRGFQNALIPYKDADLRLLFWATVLVTIGVFLEFPEIAHVVNKTRHKFKELPEPKDMKLGWELVVAIGWVLVAGGLGLEWFGDARINSVYADLDRIDQAIIENTQGLAIAAEGAAAKAQGSAKAAEDDAGVAKTLANGARTEADALEGREARAEAEITKQRQRADMAEGTLFHILRMENPRALWMNGSTQRDVDNGIASLRRVPSRAEIVYKDDEETHELADDIRSTLLAGGWEVSKPTPIPPINVLEEWQVPFTGVTITSPEFPFSHNSSAWALEMVLGRALEAGVHAGKNPPGFPDVIRVVVMPK